MEKIINWLWRAARWGGWFSLHQLLKLMSALLLWASELATTASKACGRKIGI